MDARTGLMFLAILAVLTTSASSASGQGYRPPAGPTITPYLDYFNAPLSPLLDNYQMYVRPRSELRSNLRGLGTAVTRQNQRLDQLGTDFQQMQPSEAAPTGTASTFMNLSHYYSGNRQAAYTPQRPAYRGGGGVAVGGGGRGFSPTVNFGTGGGGAFRR